MEYVRTATREYAAGERVDLRIDSASGSVVVGGGEAGQITVQVVVNAWDENPEAADTLLDRVVEGIRWDGGTLTIVTPELPGARPWFLPVHETRVSYVVTVPRRSGGRIGSRTGRVEVADIDGPLAIEARSGRVSVRRLAGDLVLATRSGAADIEEIGGRIVAATHSGKVTVRDAAGSVEVLSRSGSIQVERAGSLQVQSSSGRVTATEVSGPVRIEATSGSIAVTQARGAVRLRTSSGSITFRGPVMGDLDVEASSGSVRLEVDPDYPFFIEAESSSGSIRSDLSPRQGGPPVTGAPAAHVRTSSGGIRISRYAGV
jgi:hypothetical protein